jgi:hypothetical protein
MESTKDSSVDFKFEVVVIPALRRAAAAHGDHEKRTGQPDPNWPDWYADYIVRERTGQQLPS